MYGNVNEMADTYYGTLFSHMSYGMGESNGGCSDGNSNAEVAAAAAAAAMAAASGRTDWSHPAGCGPGSGMIPGIGQHPSSLLLRPGSNHTDLTVPPNVSPPNALASPYAATLLAAVAAAAAASYSVPPVPSNAPSVAGNQPYMTADSGNNRPGSEYAAMYYGSPARPPSASSASQITSLYGSVPNWHFAVPPNQYNSNPNMLDGWSSPAGQQTSLGTLCGEPDAPASYPRIASEDSTASNKDSTQAYYTPHLGEVSHIPSVSFPQQRSNSNEIGLPFILPTPNSKNPYPYSSNQNLLYNGLSNINGTAPTFEQYDAVEQRQKQQGLHQRMVNDFRHLTIESNEDCSNNNNKTDATKLQGSYFSRSNSKINDPNQSHLPENTQWSNQNDDEVSSFVLYNSLFEHRTPAILDSMSS